MYRKTKHTQQGDLFTSSSMMLMNKREQDFFDNEHSWHNEFYKYVTSLIDEDIFMPLYSDKNHGAPPKSIRVLVGMYWLKEGLNLTDEHLIQACGFHLLVRRALGLEDLKESCPSIDTYYLFRRRIVQYAEETGEDLLQKCYRDVASKQAKAFKLKGSYLRMDSKLVCSNIAYYSRYRIVHTTFCKETTSNDQTVFLNTNPVVLRQIQTTLLEDVEHIIYTSTSNDIRTRMLDLGYLIQAVLAIRPEGEESLLKRVFEEQYIVKDKELLLRESKDINPKSVQNPNDPDAHYRKKGDQVVRGNVVNITETVDEESGLNLVTDVQVESATTADNTFVKSAIKNTEAMTGNKVERVYADGAYHSEANQKLDVELLLTGITGKQARYRLELKDGILFVTDTHTGEIYEAEWREKAQKWRIRVGDAYRYITEDMLRAQSLRDRLGQIPKELRKKRNNVEATIYHFACCLEKNKSRYRGLVKHRFQAYARCLWMNCVRITNFEMRKALQLA